MARPATKVRRSADVIELAALVLLIACPSPRASRAAVLTDTTVVRPVARAETEPVPHRGDAADTPDIWVHPTDPARSLIIGTDKRGSLMVYDLDGRLRQSVAIDSRPNDVSVLYGFTLGGRSVDLAVAGCRPLNGHGVKLWLIDADADTLRDVTAGGVIPVFGGTLPYGTGVYRSPTGRCYFIATNKSGRLEQYLLKDAGDGRISARRVRAWSLGSMTEGCVADNELGNLYLAEERVGIWRFDAEPGGSNRGQLIAKVGEHGLKGDVEGLTIYCARGGAGYLIASSQGNSVLNVYSREGDHHYVLTIDPEAGELGDVEHSDGIAVTNCPTSRRFASGLLVAQDGSNGVRNQNFKLFGWEDIAGSRLVIDTLWSPRAPAAPPALAHAGHGSAPGDDDCTHAGSNEPLLETASACLAAPGAVMLGVGLEQGTALHRRTESTVPFTLDYAATHWLELVLEPIVYTRVHQPGRTLETGSGETEVSAIVAPFPGAWRRSVAFGFEMTLPITAHSSLGSDSPDYTMDLILSRPVASLDAHVNLGYTIVARPIGSQARNVYSFAVAAVRPFAHFDLVGELFGHTSALPASGAVVGPDVSGGDLARAELVGTLGGRLHLGARATIGLGVSYDRERTFLVSPLINLKLR